VSDRALLPHQTAAPKQDWRTPPELFRLLDDEFHFTLDAAADETNHLCDRWLGPGGEVEDALSVPWCWPSGDTIFCNPPYSKEGNPLWAKKFAEGSADNTIVALINVATSNRWWFDYVVQYASEIRFLVGRVPFIDPDTEKPIAGNRYDSAVIVYGAGRGAEIGSKLPFTYWWDWKKALLLAPKCESQPQ